MRRTTLAALAALAALVAVTLVLAGCGGDEPDPPPSSTPSGTSSGTPAGSASGDGTEPTPTESTGSTGAAVEPAAGVLLDLDRIRMRAPEGWKKNPPMSTFLIQAFDPATANTVSLSDLSAVGEASLQEQAEVAVDDGRGGEILEPVEVAGVQWYHVGGPSGRLDRFDQFGTIHRGSEAVIEFSLEKDLPAAERQALIDAVLASVEWK